jgi:hypothetical protein
VGSFEIFFSRTSVPEKLKFTWTIPDIVQFQVYSNHGNWGSGEATIGKTIFCMFPIGKILKIFFSKTI